MQQKKVPFKLLPNILLLVFIIIYLGRNGIKNLNEGHLGGCLYFIFIFFAHIFLGAPAPLKWSRNSPSTHFQTFLVRWLKKKKDEEEGFHAYFSIPLTFPTVTPEIPLPYFHLSQLNQTFSQPLFVTHVSIFTHLHAPSLPLLSCPPPLVLVPGW